MCKKKLCLLGPSFIENECQGPRPSPPPLQHCNVMWPTFVFQLRTPMRHLGAPFTREGPERYFSGQSTNRAAGFVSPMVTAFQAIRKSCKNLSSLFTAFCQNIPYVSERLCVPKRAGTRNPSKCFLTHKVLAVGVHLI